MNGECKEDKVEEKAKDVGDQNTEVLNNVEKSDNYFDHKNVNQI